jgi:hypothetical protein
VREINDCRNGALSQTKAMSALLCMANHQLQLKGVSEIRYQVVRRWLVSLPKRLHRRTVQDDALAFEIVWPNDVEVAVLKESLQSRGVGDVDAVEIARSCIW